MRANAALSAAAAAVGAKDPHAMVGARRIARVFRGVTDRHALYVAMSVNASGFYRAALPAAAGGWAWAWVPDLMLDGDGDRVLGQLAELADRYEAVVLNGAFVPTDWIRERQARGTRVVVDLDDALPESAADVPATFRALGPVVADCDREAAATRFATVRANLVAADAVIAATKYLRPIFARHNPRTFVCRVGIDTASFPRRRPTGDVVIGWAGSSLVHHETVPAWLPAIEAVMQRHPHTRFVSVGGDIGLPLGDQLAQRFGPDRAEHRPWASHDDYPAAIGELDVMLAPAGRSPLALGKADIRWLAASACGIPTVGDPAVYTDLRDGRTGLEATTAGEAKRQLERLVTSPGLRERIGREARAFVRRRRDVSVAVEQWRQALDAVLSTSSKDAGGVSR